MKISKPLYTLLCAIRCVAVWSCILCAPPCRSQPWPDKVVAAVVLGEAADQGRLGMLAVAEVIHTRCAQKHLTQYQVVTQRRAFACLDRSTPERLVNKWQDQPEFSLALQLVALRQFPGITCGATHFTRKNEKPLWAVNKKPVVVIGRHAFYRAVAY